MPNRTGSNRALVSPEAYPSSFLEAIEQGRAILLSENLLWTPISAAKRFRILLALLRRPEWSHHRLAPYAKGRWRVVPSARAVEIVRAQATDAPSRLAPALIESALRRTL